ncbi:MAG: DUF3168 domain-containing protein [Rhizobiales bacterium]|nr:DUF3168 domain-containing protein [Hyphomicrobiales bacterium]
MAEPSLSLQKLVADRLMANAEVMALIGDPANIVDTGVRPEHDLTVILGDGQTVYTGVIARAYLNVHVFVKEPGMKLAKEITGAIVDCVPHDAQIEHCYLDVDGFAVSDISINDTRFMHDDTFSHAVVNVAAIMRAD